MEAAIKYSLKSMTGLVLLCRSRSDGQISRKVWPAGWNDAHLNFLRLEQRTYLGVTELLRVKRHPFHTQEVPSSSLGLPTIHKTYLLVDYI